MVASLEFEKNISELESKLSELQHLSDTGDININSMSNLQYSKEIWGDGELRYFKSK